MDVIRNLRVSFFLLIFVPLIDVFAILGIPFHPLPAFKNFETRSVGIIRLDILAKLKVVVSPKHIKNFDSFLRSPERQQVRKKAPSELAGCARPSKNLL